MGKKEILQINNWPTKIIDIDKIKLDGQNPNSMSEKSKRQLRGSLDTFGNAQDIVIDANTFLLADGEHRLLEYKSRGIKKISAKMIPFKNDAQRRAFRQAANKIHGEHDESLDLEEYQRIIAGGEKDLLNMVTGMNLSEVEEHLRSNNPEQEIEHYEGTCRMCGGSGTVTRKRKVSKK